MAPTNLAALLTDEPVARGRGEAPAVREPKRVWSYAQLAEESRKAGNALRGLGVGPGDRVAMLMHDSADYAAVFIGAMRIGAVPTPMSVLSSSLDVRAVLAHAGARIVVVHGDLSQAVEPIRDEVESLEHILAVGGARPGQTDFLALCHAASDACELYQPGEDTAAFLLYSAGPSGHRKGVAHDHQVARHAHFGYAEAILGLDEHDRVFTTSSLASAYGLGIGLLFPLLSGACTFLLPTRPKPARVFEVLTAYQATIFASVPSLYGQMVHDFRALPQKRESPLAGVRHAVSGAEALPAALERRVQSTFGVRLLHGFGMTEAMHFVLSNRGSARREGSAGRPLPGVEARVVDDAGHTLPPMEIGTLEVRGPTVANGYYGTEPDSKAVFRNGWVRPGDRFFVDADGYFFHCGRSDDLFKVSGRWVAPEEVEKTLIAHPAVWECAVVEGFDEDGLAQPIAFVVANVGHKASPDLARDLMEYVKREIAPYKYPREVAFVENLPKSTTGKILRWKLRRGSTL